MSNLLRYDGLLARALAAELRTRLVGTRIRGLRLDRAAHHAALTVRARDGDLTLLWSLAPAASGVRVLPRRGPPPNVPLSPGARISDVSCPPDERSVVIDATTASAAVRIIFELMPTATNVVATGADGRIVGVLRPRPAGARPLDIGRTYAPPPRRARAGADEPLAAAAWRALLEPVSPDARAATLLAGVAWTSPLNVDYLLGSAAAPQPPADAVAAAHARYVELLTERPRPVLLADGARLQPYPHPLGRADALPFGTLLDAFAEVWAAARRARGAAGAPAAGDGGDLPAAADAALVNRARRALDHRRRRALRLRAELSGAAADAERLRTDGGLLLAQLYRVERGADQVELDDFAGGTRRLALDPALAPAENAEQLYVAARRRARAAARLPALVEAAERDAAALGAWLAAIEAGESAGPPPVELAPTVATRGAEAERPAPYRRFRTSGGLEVRVGRSGKANDELTFHHSSPNDIWLHARDVGGAHVVLRWSDAQANPPARDLTEAAGLAALHSRARTSGLVAVDWTRRKYVRKPRKAKPGLVTIERAKTLFVEPDAQLEARLGT